MGKLLGVGVLVAGGGAWHIRRTCLLVKVKLSATALSSPHPVLTSPPDPHACALKLEDLVGL